MGKQKTKILINPPPDDARCECCGRHVSEVKPFGGKGDPLFGDFSGHLLVQNYRGSEHKSIQFKVDDMLDKDGRLDEDKFVERHGEKALKDYWFAEQLINTVGASWECRDCFILDGIEFYNKRDGVTQGET